MKIYSLKRWATLEASKSENHKCLLSKFVFAFVALCLFGQFGFRHHQPKKWTPKSPVCQLTYSSNNTQYCSARGRHCFASTYQSKSNLEHWSNQTKASKLTELLYVTKSGRHIQRWLYWHESFNNNFAKASVQTLGLNATNNMNTNTTPTLICIDYIYTVYPVRVDTYWAARYALSPSPSIFNFERSFRNLRLQSRIWFGLAMIPVWTVSLWSLSLYLVRICLCFLSLTVKRYTANS